MSLDLTSSRSSTSQGCASDAQGARLERLRALLANRDPSAPVRHGPSHELDYGRHFGPPPFDARQAAVLVVLAEFDGQWRIPLTVRSPALRAHAGQVCLPGGKLEAGETAEQCALREATEEIGLHREDLDLIGRLSPVYIYASNHWVTPCLATTGRIPEFQTNPGEVASVFWLPLEAIDDPARRGVHEVRRWGSSFRTPHLAWDGRLIWGATRLVLDELVALWRHVAPAG